MNINFFSSTYAKLGTKAKNTMNRLREWRFCLSEVRRCESSTSLFFMKWNEGALHIRKPMSELCLQPMDLIKLITASLLTFSLGRAPSIRLKNIYLSYEVWIKTHTHTHTHTHIHTHTHTHTHTHIHIHIHTYIHAYKHIHRLVYTSRYKVPLAFSSKI